MGTTNQENVAQRSGRVMMCPRCKKELKVVFQEDVEIDTCLECNGVWVDLIEEKKILNMKPEVFTVDELHRLRKYYQSLGRVEEIKYVPCPICNKLMQRKNWGAHSGVVVDKCYDHGTWYDVGEIEKIREFIKHGGVEYEKLRKTEFGLSDLERKLEDEALRLDMRIDKAYRRARLFNMLGF